MKATTESVEVTGTVLSEERVTAIEIIVNGQVVHRLTPAGGPNAQGAMETVFRQRLELSGSSWVAVRCWEQRPGGRFRFAHTAPTFFDRPGAPLRPRREEVDFLIQRTREEIERSTPVLTKEALMEYRRALAEYEKIGQGVR